MDKLNKEILKDIEIDGQRQFLNDTDLTPEVKALMENEHANKN